MYPYLRLEQPVLSAFHRVLDRDTLSSDDIIGALFIDLSNLMSNNSNSISGWFPIYDTFRGIRGELEVVIEVEYFGSKAIGVDSGGYIKFFSSPYPYSDAVISDIKGFVEELIVDDDPEYNWKDNFRTSRSSNEARQYLLYKLSGKLRRQISNKVREMGGNAVLGFRKHFDLESEGFIVIRGYGTAVTLKKKKRMNYLSNSTSSLPSPDLLEDVGESPQFKVLTDSPVRKDYDYLSSSFGPFDNSFTNKEFSLTKLIAGDVQILTIGKFPPPIEMRIGGIVSARSVRIIPKGEKSEDKGRALRDKWWSELREEIKSHAKSLNCQYIMGYSEVASIREHVVVLTALGTAARVSLPKALRDPGTNSSEYDLTLSSDLIHVSGNAKSKSITIPSKGNPVPDDSWTQTEESHSGCYPCHIPFKQSSSPYPMKFNHCNICKKRFVPEILLASIEPPPGIQVLGKGVHLEAHVCRAKRKLQGEADANQLAELIPFLEYDLHKQIVMKLRLLGLNAVFKFETQIREGDNVIIGFAHGTAIFLDALPRPDPLKLKNHEPQHKLKIKELTKFSIVNAQALDVTESESYPDLHNSTDTLRQNDSDASEDRTLQTVFDIHGDDMCLESSNESYEFPETSLKTSSNMVIDADEKVNEEIINSLVSQHSRRREDFFMTTSETMPGIRKESLTNMGLITIVRVIDWPQQRGQSELNKLFTHIFDSTFENLHFRLKPLTPCLLSGVKYDIQIPDDDEIQIIFTASLMSLTKKKKKEKKKKKKKELVRLTPKVEITSLSYIPEAHVEGFLGRISLSFIKESFSVREQGGMNAFAQNFMMEAQSLARSHVEALGGNALLCFQYQQCEFTTKTNKNQAYCVVNVTGDAVTVSHTETSHDGYNKMAKSINKRHAK